MKAEDILQATATVELLEIGVKRGQNEALRPQMNIPRRIHMNRTPKPMQLLGRASPRTCQRNELGCPGTSWGERSPHAHEENREEFEKLRAKVARLSTDQG